MTIVNGTFTAGAQTSDVLKTVKDDRIVISLSGTWTGAVLGEKRSNVNEAWCQCVNRTTNGNSYVIIDIPSGEYRLRAASVSSGTINYRLETADAQTYINPEWDDLRFPSAGVNPPGAVSDPGRDNTETDFPGSYLFDATAVEMLSYSVQMPHTWVVGTNVRPHIHWAKTTSASGNVIWHLYYRFLNVGAAPDAWVGPIVGTIATNDPNTAEAEIITTFGDIPMGDRRLSNNIAYRLYRKADDGGDTYAADARLHEFDIHYQKGQNGSAAEFLYIP